MIYYNQRNYANVVYSYQKPPNPKQTIATAGCGPTCCAMIAGNLSGELTATPPVLAKFAVEKGYRVDGGTNMMAMAPGFAKKYGYQSRQTGNINEVVAHLEGGGMAIANVAGGKNGLFSNSGHYIVLWKMEGGLVRVLDPYLYVGKFSTVGRKGKVTQNGDIIRVSAANLDLDVRKDYKAYYLFSK